MATFVSLPACLRHQPLLFPSSASRRGSPLKFLPVCENWQLWMAPMWCVGELARVPQWHATLNLKFKARPLGQGIMRCCQRGLIAIRLILDRKSSFSDKKVREKEKEWECQANNHGGRYRQRKGRMKEIAFISIFFVLITSFVLNFHHFHYCPKPSVRVQVYGLIKRGINLNPVPCPHAGNQLNV